VPSSKTSIRRCVKVDPGLDPGMSRRRSGARTFAEAYARARARVRRVGRHELLGPTNRAVCLRVAGRQHPASRVAYLARHGSLPDDRPWILHDPHCRFRNCIALGCLRAGTPRENTADMLISGTRPLGENHPRARLSGRTVREARRLSRQGIPVAVLARRYGVASSTMTDAIRGQTWRVVR
jgi:hypothetical protein